MISADLRTCQAEFSFPGDLASVPTARDQVLDWIQQYCSTETELFDVLIALQEAFANAAIHGCGGDAAKRVNCSVTLQGDLLTITVRDPGKGFDVDAIADPAKYQASTLQHGRGIALMRGLVDHLAFAHNGSQVQLSKKIART